MKKWSYLFLIPILLLSSCNLGKSAKETKDPNAVYTSAAQTVAVQLTQNAQKQPSTTQTPTQAATTAPLPTGPALQETIVSPSRTTQPTTAATQPSVADRVEFVSQTPQDGTAYAPKESFKVTWQVKNVGQTTWTTDYKIRFFSGNRIGAGLANEYSFPKSAAPGETISITVDFLTGADTGEFQSNWVLTNQNGQNFYPLYISIRVAIPTQTPTPTYTTEPTATSETPTSGD